MSQTDIDGWRIGWAIGCPVASLLRALPTKVEEPELGYPIGTLVTGPIYGHWLPLLVSFVRVRQQAHRARA